MSKACWSCGADPQDVICVSCGKLQPFEDADPFSRLYMLHLFSLDAQELETKYFEAQRIFHPDRFIQSAKIERIYAAQYSAAINEAYSILKDPIRRAQALLKHYRHQFPNIEEQTLQDPELLAEVMTLREKMIDLQSQSEIKALQQYIEDLLAHAIVEITQAFEDLKLDDATRQLNRLRYFSKLKTELAFKKVQE